MKILVTGSSGFLGRHLCRELEKRGHELTKLTSKNCNLLDIQNLADLPKTTYDQMFHLAAWTQPGDFCLSHSGEQWIINQQINTNMLAWWVREQPGAKLITIGSSCCYSPHHELVEGNYMQNTPHESLSAYAMTKRMLYEGCKAIAKQYSLKYLHIVPSTLYGPDYHLDGRQMHFIFDLIRKIVIAKNFTSPPVLWGNGLQRRELIYMDDFIHIMLDLNENYENDIFNVGSGEGHTIKDFAARICSIVDYSKHLIRYDTSRYVGSPSKILTIGKARKAAKDYELTPLDDGLEKTINWYQENKR